MTPHQKKSFEVFKALDPLDSMSILQLSQAVGCANVTAWKFVTTQHAAGKLFITEYDMDISLRPTAQYRLRTKQGQRDAVKPVPFTEKERCTQYRERHRTIINARATAKRIRLGQKAKPMNPWAQLMA